MSSCGLFRAEQSESIISFASAVSHHIKSNVEVLSASGVVSGIGISLKYHKPMKEFSPSGPFWNIMFTMDDGHTNGRWRRDGMGGQVIGYVCQLINRGTPPLLPPVPVLLDGFDFNEGIGTSKLRTKLETGLN